MAIGGGNGDGGDVLVRVCLLGPIEIRDGANSSAVAGYLPDELGLDPSPELQALERWMLAHDPALASPVTLAPTVPAGAGLPVPPTSFVGREAELARLDAAITESRTTTVLGPAGVDKTRLVLKHGHSFGAGLSDIGAHPRRETRRD